MTFIKNVDEIRDYSYVEIAIDFGERKTAEEILAYVKNLSNQLAATTRGYHNVEIKKIDRESPKDKE
jgi:ribosomal protein L18E